jgi:hypothetical protein
VSAVETILRPPTWRASLGRLVAESAGDQVVNLMKLQPQSEHPHGLSDKEFDVLFTTSKPINFAFHGYPLLIHRLTYRRTNHRNLHVRGYKEEGTTTTAPEGGRWCVRPRPASFSQGAAFGRSTC